MKIPKLKDLAYDRESALKIHEMAKSKKVKITINIDLDNLQKVKKIAEKNGASYQKLINQLLGQALRMGANLNFSIERIERLEKEVEKLKKKIA